MASTYKSTDVFSLLWYEIYVGSKFTNHLLSLAPRGSWIIRFSPVENAEMFFTGEHSVKDLPVFYWSSPYRIADDPFRKLMAIVIQMFLERDYARLTQLMLQTSLASELIDQFNTFIDSTNEDPFEMEELLLESAHESVQLHFENEQLLYLDLLVLNDFDPNYKLREILSRRKTLGSTMKPHIAPNRQNPLPNERSEDTLLLIPTVAEPLVPSAPDEVSTCTSNTTEQENDNILNSTDNNLDKTGSKIELVNCQPRDEASSPLVSSAPDEVSTCTSNTTEQENDNILNSTDNNLDKTGSKIELVNCRPRDEASSKLTGLSGESLVTTSVKLSHVADQPEHHQSTSVTCQSSEKGQTQLTPNLNEMLSSSPQLHEIPHQTLENSNKVLESGETLETNGALNLSTNKENEKVENKESQQAHDGNGDVDTLGPKIDLHGDSNSISGENIDNVICDREKAGSESLSTKQCTMPFLPIYGLSRNLVGNKMRSQKVTTGVNERKTEFGERKEKRDTENVTTDLPLICGFPPIHGLSFGLLSPGRQKTRGQWTGAQSKKRGTDGDNVVFFPKRMRCEAGVVPVDTEGCSLNVQGYKKNENLGCAETENSAEVVHSGEQVNQMQDSPDADDDDNNSESLEWHDAMEDLE